MWMPGEALVAPGPRVTKQMPGRPVALPTASAIMAAPPSCRQTVTVIVAVMEGIERREIALARHAEHVLHAVDDELVDQDLAAGAGAVIGAQHGSLLVLQTCKSIARRASPGLLLAYPRRSDAYFA